MVDPADCKTPEEELAKAQRILTEIRPEGDFAALQVRLTRKSPKGSPPKKKPVSGQVIWMDQGQV